MEQEDVCAYDGERISEGKNYIIIKGSFMKLVKLKTQKQCQLGRSSLEVSPLLGHPVGTQFRLRAAAGKQRILRPEPVERTEDLAADIAAEGSAADNRHLVADQTSQAMTKERIMEMRDQGATGREIVNTIVDGSASFQGKTEFSQEKYVRKKQKKYFEFISVHEPSVRLVASMYYMQDPLKIMNLRLDSVSQLLTALSVHPGGRYLALESGCLALTVAAVLERLGGHGRLVHLYRGGTPQRHAVDAINFSREQLACLSCLELRTLLAHHPADSTVAATTATTTITASSDATTTTTATAAAAAAANAEQSSTEASSQEGDATSHNGHTTAQTDNSGPAATSAVQDEVTPPGGDGVTSDTAPPDGGEVTASDGGDPEPSSGKEAPPAADGSVEPAGTEQDAESTTEVGSRKRRLSGDRTDAPERRSKYARTRSGDSELALRELSSGDLDGLLLCCRQHPVDLLRYLIRFLAVSRPFAVFCPYKEPLLECYFAMKAEGCIMLKVTETWMRNYQVLPERTHPEIKMSGGGGYILSGIKVDRSLNRTAATD